MIKTRYIFFIIPLVLLASCIYSVVYLNKPNPEVEKWREQMTLTLGTPLTYTANLVGTFEISIAKLDSSHLIILYYDLDDLDLKAVVVSVSGTTFTAGTPVQVDASAGNSTFDIIGLSSSKAIAVYTAFGGDIDGRIVNVSGTTISSVGTNYTIAPDGNSGGDTNHFSATPLTVTEAIVAYIDNDNSDQGTTRALDVSGDIITVGAAHIFDASTIFQPIVSAINTTQAIVTIIDGGTSPANRGVTYILTKTGSVMTNGSGTAFTALGITSATNVYAGNSLAVASYRHSGGSLYAITLSISGTTITVGTETEIDSDSPVVVISASRIDNKTVVVTYAKSGSNYAIEGLISGTSISGDTPLDVGAGDQTDAAVYLSPNVAIVKDEEVVAVTSSNAVSGGITQQAPMFKPCSIDADGSNIYMAGLNGDDTPVLVKFPTSLDTDGTLVYDPGSGADIGVECGIFDNDVIWVAGDFGGTDVVAKSEDGGDTFTIKDDGSFGTVESFKVGPDSDDRILISDVDNDDLQETIDDGDNWTQINAAVGFDIKAIARLDKNVQESVFGNEGNATDNIDYSVNSGSDLEDITSGFDQERDITGLEVG